MMSDDMALVQEFARNNSEQAFATLVSRHVNLVYSVALRRVGEPHLAEDVTQGVFIILAKKAKSLGPKTILPAWLCRTARYVSSHAIRTQQRRHAREQEAHMQSMTNEPDADAWSQIAPMLDEALGSLTQPEHDAVVLRFFGGKPFAEVSAAIGTSEEAARMRVARAVEKLRKFFCRRGVGVSVAVLSGVITANSVGATPAALASAATASAVQGTVVSTGISTLVQSAMKTMTWLKMKLAIGIGVTALIAGTALVAVASKQGAQNHQQDSLLIVPQVSVGKVVRGMTTNEVEAVLGKPDKWRGSIMVYDKEFAMSVVQSGKGAWVVFCGNQMFAESSLKKFNGRTKEGIGAGSSKAEVMKAFGQPDATQATNDGHSLWEQLEYMNNGALTFTFQNDKVVGMIVRFDLAAK